MQNPCCQNKTFLVKLHSCCHLSSELLEGVMAMLKDHKPLIDAGVCERVCVCVDQDW